MIPAMRRGTGETREARISWSAIRRLLAFFIMIQVFCGENLAFDEGSAVSKAKPPRPAITKDALIRDWMHQDYMAIDLPESLARQKEAWRAKHLTRPEARFDAPVLEHPHCFTSGRDATVEIRMVERVLDALDDATVFRARLDALRTEGAPGADPRWKTLYIDVCGKRRVLRLAPLLTRWTRFVFNEHRHIPGSWKYTEGLSDAQAGRFFAPGAALNILDLDAGATFGDLGSVVPLIEIPGARSATPTFPGMESGCSSPGRRTTGKTTTTSTSST